MCRSGPAGAESPPGVRVTGVPLSALTRLRCDETYAELRSCLDMRDELARTGARLSDELYAVIGGLADRSAKPGLVGLRRAVYQLRAPGEREWNHEIAELLPTSLCDRVGNWLDLLHAYRARLAVVDELLETEIRQKRAQLHLVTGDAHFLRALSLSSPALYGVLRKWHAQPGRLPKRQSITRLVKYLARAAAKTSPYSTFTMSGLGRWSADAATTHYPDTGAARCLLEVDRLAFERIRDALGTDARLRHELTVRVNPSTTISDDSVSCLAPSRDEPIVTVPVSKAVLEVLRAASADEPLTVSQLCAVLGAEHGNVEAIERFVGKLGEAGLLETHIPVADQSERPFADLSEWLAANAPPDFETCRELAGSIHRELSRSVPAADLDTHQARERSLAEDVRGLAEAAGQGSAAGDTEETGSPRQGEVTLHENALYHGASVECAVREWNPALDDLDILRRWLAVHDPVMPLRLVLGSFIRERFGVDARVPLIELHRAIHEEIDAGTEPFGPELKAAMDLAFTTNPLMRRTSGLDRVRELYRLQEEASSALLTGTGDGGEIVADPAHISAMIDRWPSWVLAPRSVMCFVQQVPAYATGDVPWLVLNAASTGYGRGRNRIHQQLRMTGDTPESLRVTAAEHGVVTAELAGAFGSGLNRKQPTADVELDYPGVVPGRPPGERLAVGDLVVTLDPERTLPELESSSLGTRVKPLHLGTMADSLLPPVARLISHVFGGTYLKHPAATLLNDMADSGAPEDIVHQPRLRIGNVVLRRASWLVPVRLAPARGAQERQAEYLFRLLGWLRQHGIPETCFVRALAGALFDDELAPDALPYWAFRKSRKPLFVDAGNAYLVELFEQLVSDPDTAVLLIEEALPDPVDAPCDAGGEQRVAEFIVEVSERGDVNA